MRNEISEFGSILLFIIGGLAFIIAGLFSAKIIRSHKPNEEKLSIYECGEEPIGGAWVNFNIRFYIIALIFLLFDVEIVLLFPVLARMAGSFSFPLMVGTFIFLIILVLGLFHEWNEGSLDWAQ